MWHDNETDVDLLGFEVHADLIKDVVTNPKLLPVSIGIFGDWGSGKSSIMKMLEKKLESNDRIVAIKFNGWVFEGYDDAKSALMESILKSLSENACISEDGKNAIVNLLKRVNWLRAGKLLANNVVIPVAKACFTGGLSLVTDTASKYLDLFNDPSKLVEAIKSKEGQGLIDNLKGIIKQKEEDSVFETVREFRDHFEDAIDKCNIDTLVILIDDLDRCSPDRIIDSLEAIKLFFNVKKTAFVIGADKRIVRHAIQHRYKAVDLRASEIDDYESLVTDYLEKIIQIPYILPRLSETEVETYLSLLFCMRDLDDDFNLVVETFSKFRKSDRHSTFGYQNIKEVISDTSKLKQLQIIPTLAPLITDGLKGNPRQIKRFLNAYTLRRKLAEIAHIPDFKTDVLIKLMILEYMDADHFVKLHEAQSIEKGFPKLISDIETNYQKSEYISSNYSEWNKTHLKRWFQMQPRLRDVDLRDYFWVSRDKLQLSLQSVSLVSPVVRKEYQAIFDSPTNSLRNNRLSTIKERLSTSEYLEQFTKLTTDAILKDPSIITNHNIMHELCVNNVITCDDYSNVFTKIVNIDTIQASVGNNLYILQQKGVNVRSIISIIEKKPRSKIYLTFMKNNK